MDLDLTSGKLWISVLIGALVLAAVSAGFQKAQATEDEELNVKGILRDGILGGIFVAMAWTLVPESMTTLSDSVTTTVSTAATKVAAPITRSGGGGIDIDLQVGPAQF